MTRSTSMAYLPVDGTAALKASHARPSLTLIEGGAAPERVVPHETLTARQTLLVSLVGVVLICALGVVSLITDALISAAEQAALDSARVESVTVHEGDTLWGIAQAHCPKEVDMSALVRWIEEENGLGNKVIVPGQVLRVPAGN